MLAGGSIPLAIAIIRPHLSNVQKNGHIHLPKPELLTTKQIRNTLLMEDAKRYIASNYKCLNYNEWWVFKLYLLIALLFYCNTCSKNY